MESKELGEAVAVIIANQKNMAGDIKDIKEISKNVVLKKDCLMSKTNGDTPVRQRELSRVYKLIFWLMGIVFGGGGSGFAIWQAVK